jgi:hypothetical protein
VLLSFGIVLLSVAGSLVALTAFVMLEPVRLASYFLLLLGVTFGTANWWWRVRPRELALERRARGLCGECGYDLCATPERCPECGLRAESAAMVFGSEQAEPRHRGGSQAGRQSLPG